MLENIRISIQGIWSHKMRSFLTMLGIIIGIASIIAIVSTLKGTNEQIKEDLIGAGNNTVSITLNYGDSAYDQDYGMSDGKAAPLLSDEQKEEVRKLSCRECDIFLQSFLCEQRLLSECQFPGRKHLWNRHGVSGNSRVYGQSG